MVLDVVLKDGPNREAPISKKRKRERWSSNRTKRKKKVEIIRVGV